MKATEWAEIISALDSNNISTAVGAAERLHKESSTEDIPGLLSLLEHENFTIREAAAFPLAELAGASALSALFAALQRGTSEGLDNDGLSAALIEVASLYPEETKVALMELLSSSDAQVREDAEWLLAFCE